MRVRVFIGILIGIIIIVATLGGLMYHGIIDIKANQKAQPVPGKVTTQPLQADERVYSFQGGDGYASPPIPITRFLEITENPQWKQVGEFFYVYLTLRDVGASKEKSESEFYNLQAKLHKEAKGDIDSADILFQNLSKNKDPQAYKFRAGALTMKGFEQFMARTRTGVIRLVHGKVEREKNSAGEWVLVSTYPDGIERVEAGEVSLKSRTLDALNDAHRSGVNCLGQGARAKASADDAKNSWEAADRNSSCLNKTAQELSKKKCFD